MVRERKGWWGVGERRQLKHSKYDFPTYKSNRCRLKLTIIYNMRLKEIVGALINRPLAIFLPSSAFIFHPLLFKRCLLTESDMGKGLVDIEKHFAFYGAYHCNPVNILIHIFFVWPVFFTALILLEFTSTHLRLPFLGGIDLKFSSIMALLYAGFYVALDRKAGSLAALLCLLYWIGSESVAACLGFSVAWKVVLAAQLFCWTAQFIGHTLFEKRVAAPVDSLVQALLLDPFFVVLELLQSLFEYEPYPGFHASVVNKIEMDRVQWQTQKQKSS